MIAISYTKWNIFENTFIIPKLSGLPTSLMFFLLCKAFSLFLIQEVLFLENYNHWDHCSCHWKERSGIHEKIHVFTLNSTALKHYQQCIVFSSPINNSGRIQEEFHLLKSMKLGFFKMLALFAPRVLNTLASCENFLLNLQILL